MEFIKIELFDLSVWTSTGTFDRKQGNIKLQEVSPDDAVCSKLLVASRISCNGNWIPPKIKRNAN